MKKTNPSEPKPKKKGSPKSAHMDHITTLFLTAHKNLGNFFVLKHPCSFSVISSTKKIQSSKQHISTYKQVESKQKETQRREEKKPHTHIQNKLAQFPNFQQKKT